MIQDLYNYLITPFHNLFIAEKNYVFILWFMLLAGQCLRIMRNGLVKASLKHCYDFIKICVILFFVIDFIYYSIGGPTRLHGPCMEPTLKGGERVWINMVAYGFVFPFTRWMVIKFKPPQRGDIVIAAPSNDPKLEQRRYGITGEEKYILKRCVGLPGEKVTIVGCKIYINDKLLDEPYIDEEVIESRLRMRIFYRGEPVDSESLIKSYRKRKKTFQLSSNEYFLIGDNRYVSAYGVFKREEIIGKIIKK